MTVKYHLLNQHDIPYEQSKQETVYECGLCLYRGLQSQYEKHLLFVRPEFDFTIVRFGKLPESCEFCDFRCNDIKLSRAKTQMRVHMRCKYKCDVCGHQSSRKQEVYRHMDFDLLGQSSSEVKALKRSILDNIRDLSLRLHGSIG